VGGDLERTRPGGRGRAQGGVAMPLEFAAGLGTNLEGVRDYLPIAEHGVIGDQRSVALVGTCEPAVILQGGWRAVGAAL
jgi:hypothetical protein